MFKEVKKAASDAIRDVDLGKGEAVINFATYVSKDRDGDKANQGMFTKSWNEFKDVRFFKNHDKNTGPGKILKLWDDSEHAKSHVKFGTHTEGQDVLKQMDEGIIKDASYLFVPMKGTPFTTGGYNYTEVFHKEVSALTHWGAHPESKVQAVKKSAESLLIPGDIAKELSTMELNFLREFIADSNAKMIQLVQFAATVSEDSDLYRWVHDVIGSLSYSIYSYKNQLVWNKPREKSWEAEAQERLTKLKSFIKNTSASDATILEVEKEAEFIEGLIKCANGTQSSISTQEQQTGGNDEAEAIALLNLQMLLES